MTEASLHPPLFASPPEAAPKEARIRMAEGAGSPRLRVSTLDTVAELRPESDLVIAARRGDAEAFGDLVRTHQDRLFGYLCRITANAHDAEDLAQETFLKAWRALDRYEHRQPFAVWLFTIAKRSALNHLRDRKPMAEEDPPEQPDHAHPAALAEQADESASVWAVARRLKPDQFEALWLRYGEGFSVDEAAKVMGKNSIHVRVLLHRGRARLGELLEKTGLKENL